jgi:hypothetical protein
MSEDQSRMTEARGIAARLTSSERRALWWLPIDGSEAPSTMETRATWPPLERRGLVLRRQPPAPQARMWRLSPLGKSVRAALATEPANAE